MRISEPDLLLRFRIAFYFIIVLTDDRRVLKMFSRSTIIKISINKNDSFENIFNSWRLFIGTIKDTIQKYNR